MVILNSDIQRQINSNLISEISDAITLNDSTSTKIADVRIKSTGRPDRIFFAVSNPSNKEVWLKLQPTATDDDKKGIHMPPQSYWEMPTDNIYKGEISAIAKSGSPDVYVTEY